MCFAFSPLGKVSLYKVGVYLNKRIFYINKLWMKLSTIIDYLNRRIRNCEFVVECKLVTRIAERTYSRAIVRQLFIIRFV